MLVLHICINKKMVIILLFQNKTMLGSYIQQSIFGANTPMPAVLSYYQHQKEPFRLPVSITEYLVCCHSCYYYWLVTKTKQKQINIFGVQPVSVLPKRGNVSTYRAINHAVDLWRFYYVSVPNIVFLGYSPYLLLRYLKAYSATF